MNELHQPSETVDIDIAGASTYRIVVEGDLDPSYSDRVAGMIISNASRGDRKPITTLIGKIRDQAELSGVLEALYCLHLPILSVVRQDDD